jgi:hypothetical protein
MARSSPTRPSSACIWSASTVSTSTPVSTPSGGRSPGRSRRCARTTSIGPWSATGIDDANFAKGPAKFFKKLPAPVRPLVVAVIRRKVRSGLKAHGIGRHTPEEIAELARRDIDALAAVLGEKPYLMGDKPCGADATAFAFAAGLLCPIFAAPSRRAAEEHPNLVAYRDRMMGEFYPALAGAA